MTSQVEVPPLTGLIHFISGKRRVNISHHFVVAFPCEKQKDTVFLMVCEKKTLSMIFSSDRKMPTLGYISPVGNSASLISNWNVGPSS